MPDSIKLPPWLGTALAALSLMIAIAGSYADNRAHIAVLEQRVLVLETANDQLTEELTTSRGGSNGRERRLARLEIMVCLIGSHLSVPGLTSSNCRADK